MSEQLQAQTPAQDLTPSMQELMAQMAQMQAELNSLKERAKALPPVALEQPANLKPNPGPNPAMSGTRRQTLKRLGLALLGGAVAAAAVGGSPAEAKIIANASSTNKIGALVILPGASNSTGTAPNLNYGLVALADTTTFDLSTLPKNNTGIFGKGTYGVYGDGGNAGVYGYSASSTGVLGVGGTYGVYGEGGYGVYGAGGTYAGYFAGDVNVSGTLSKTAGSFKIDHPLDPANKYLYHSFVESPDMLNIYNGNVTLDSHGEATVTMPDWFEALNSDFRYQLTCLGQFAPVYIAEKLQARKFKLAGGQPGQEISWMVTGIRQDAYARAHRIPVEEEKSATEKGKYLHPELFGQPIEKSVHPQPVAAGK